jgi:multiple sugar transport system ATP-binding protein
MAAKIVLENVCKVYPGGVTAVDGANLEIHDREFIVLVGPSGCGKSTTLRMIAGLDGISSGSIFIDGRRVNDLAPKDRDIAMVFQNYALYPHMTAYENMAFGLMLRKYPKAEIDARVREAAKTLDITEEQLKRKPKSLSGGQRQRVAVGRAIVRKPKAFLFDEPLSNLDAKMRVEMRTEISKLHGRLQSTMIYVTHDQVEAMTMGDRIVVMRDGVIQQVDDPLTLYDNPRNMFVAGFMGSPPMNFFRGIIQQRQDGVWFVESGSRETAGFAVHVDRNMTDKLALTVGSPVVFGSRPEDIAILPTGAPDPSADPSADPSEGAAAVTVEVVEPMGAETHLYLSTGANNFVARVHTRERMKPGEKLNVAFDMRKCHFFDASERVII